MWSQSGPELGEPAGRDAGGHQRPAVRLERADHEPAAVVADVQEPVEVADERLRLDRQRRLLGHHPHVLGGHQRDAAAGEARQLRRPQARREDHGLRVDVAARGRQPGHRPAVAAQEAGDRGAGDVPDAAVDGALREGQRREPGLTVPSPGYQVPPTRSSTARPAHSSRIPSGSTIRTSMPWSRAIDTAGEQLVHPGLGPRDAQRPVPAEPGVDARLVAQSLVGLGVAGGERRQRLRPARLRDEPGRVPRRAVGQPATLEEHDVTLARRRQVVRDRRPDDPAADDDDRGRGRGRSEAGRTAATSRSRLARCSGTGMAAAS